MRTLIVALAGVVLLGGVTLNPVHAIPSVSRDSLLIKEAVADSSNTLIVERPVGAKGGTTSSVFVVAGDGGELRRVQVRYGLASLSFIEVLSGLSPGDRIVVSDMHTWDAWERLRIKSR